jgi:hypothetical protein
MPAMKNHITAYHPMTIGPAYRRSAGMMLLLAINFSLSAQSKVGFEHYNYIRQSDGAGLVPMFHLQTKNNWYTELRYNYEDAQTLSLFAGKAFESGKAIEYTIIPMMGFSIGRFTGASIGLNTDITWKNFDLSTQSQYSIAMKKNTNDFFFNWSELTYSFSQNIFAGIAMQYTLQTKQQALEPGIVAGVNLKNVSFPIYAFNLFRTDSYFVVGVNYEYKLGKNK